MARTGSRRFRGRFGKAGGIHRSKRLIKRLTSIDRATDAVTTDANINLLVQTTQEHPPIPDSLNGAEDVNNDGIPGVATAHKQPVFYHSKIIRWTA
jgi:hypothetical protein